VGFKTTEIIDMPNRKAKDRKRKRALLNKKWSIEGRTAAQRKKWLAKEKAKGTQLPIYGRR
jgi:hypothetical protein